MKTMLLILAAFSLSLPAHAAQSPSPLAALSDAEQSYYDQSFAYAMDTVAAGAHYDWATYSGGGSIAIADAAFTSKSGYSCRHFSEAFAIGGQSAGDEGIACKRMGKDGWCKLKTGDAQTCAMEAPPNVIDETVRDAGEAVQEKKLQTNSWIYWFKERF